MEPEKRLHTALVLLVLMIAIVVGIHEYRIPTATYEVTTFDMNEAESIEISSSPMAPVSSAVLLNESPMSPDSIWLKRRDFSRNRSSFSRAMPLPRNNVSSITLRLSALIVEGPLEITLNYGWQDTYSADGTTGEYVEIVSHVSPDHFSSRQNLLWVGVSFEGVDWEVVDQLYISVQAMFTTPLSPLTVDLQRTNGDSLFDLPEFFLIWDEEHRPRISLNNEEVYVSQVNDTIYLIEGSYSLRVRWSGYDSYFPDISISNESVYLEIRIETVRVDIRSLQKIPGVTVYVDAWGGDEFYAYEILIADEPSFYVPSMSHIWFGIEGGPESFRSPHHFSYYLQNYDNGNVTLSVNENWILIGNVAMTPGRFVMMIALVSIFVLTILIFRRKILESSIYAPFLLLVLGNALPTYTTSRTSYRFPLALPIYSNYLETQTVSIGIGSSISSLDGGVLAVSSAGYDVMTQIGYISIALLLVAFGTILYEYLRKDTDLETSDFPMLVSVLATLIFQIVFTANFFISNISWRNVTLGPALIFTSLANIVWIILYKRQGKPIFETN